MTAPGVGAAGGADRDGEKVGERRAPVVVTMGVVIVLPFLMPHQVATDLRWLLAGLESMLLIAMLAMDPGRIDRRSKAVRAVRRSLIGVLAVGSGFATLRLVDVIVTGSAGANSAGDLLRAGGLVWLYVVIAFSFAYWELDCGGPGERAHAPRAHPDLMFPQHANPELAPDGWRPVFLDYLYVGVNSSLAFSPTDTMPLTHWAKAAMAIQSVASVVILGLVIARAVNILA